MAWLRLENLEAASFGSRWTSQPVSKQVHDEVMWLSARYILPWAQHRQRGDSAHSKGCSTLHSRNDLLKSNVYSVTASRPKGMDGRKSLLC